MKCVRLVSLAAVILGLACVSQASANSVYITGVASQDVRDSANRQVGPYSLTIQGSATPISAVCFRDDLGTLVPWWADYVKASDVPHSTYDPTVLAKVAWLYGNFTGTKASNNWADVHDALWAVTGDPHPLSLGAQAYLASANATVGAWTDTQRDTYLASYYVFLPQDPALRQPFITTPEPASLGLILMGSGLATVVRRRRRKA